MFAAPVRRCTCRTLAVMILAVLASLAVQRPAQAAAKPTLGIHAHLLWADVDGPELERQLDASKQAGARIVRVDVGWSSLEQGGKGQWSTWYRDRLDNLVEQAHKRNLKLLLTLADSPCWASSAPASIKQSCAGSWWDRGVQYYTPTNPQDYADALATLVRRYGSRVAAWEIWNEPNSPDYYKAPDAARDYVAIVRAAYRAAKGVDRNTKIVAGAVMQSDYEFTERLYAAGIKGYFDAFSIHPYCEDRAPSDPWHDEWMRLSFIRGIPKVRSVMARHGDWRPMWLTEFGWSTSTTRNAGAQNNGVDESTQASDVADAIGLLPRWPYVETAIYYNLVNTTDDRASRYGNYGLIRRDGSRKLAFAAYRDAARMLSSSSSASVAKAAAPSVVVPASAPASGGKPYIATPRMRRLSLIVRRVRHGFRITGASDAGARLRLAIHRVRRGRAVKRPTLRRVVRASTAGRFVVVVHDRRLTRGAWRVLPHRLR
jgi:hypothetical protein